MSKVWADEANVTKLVELYKAAVEEHGADVASSSEFLTKLGKENFADYTVTVRMVRGKLISLGEYVKPTQQASISKVNPVRKEHYVRAIANTLNIDADDIDSFKSAKVNALSAITDKLGVTDILAAAAKDYSPRPELVVMKLMENLEIDLDDLDAFKHELESTNEAA